MAEHSERAGWRGEDELERWRSRSAQQQTHRGMESATAFNVSLKNPMPRLSTHIWEKIQIVHVLVFLSSFAEGRLGRTLTLKHCLKTGGKDC